MGTTFGKVAVIGGVKLFLYHSEFGFCPLDCGKPLEIFNCMSNMISSCGIERSFVWHCKGLISLEKFEGRDNQ